MDKDTHVYCICCKHLKQSNSEDFPFTCEYESECDFTDTEDSRVFEMRPRYEPLTKGSSNAIIEVAGYSCGRCGYVFRKNDWTEVGQTGECMCASEYVFDGEKLIETSYMARTKIFPYYRRVHLVY